MSFVMASRWTTGLAVFFAFTVCRGCARADGVQPAAPAAAVSASGDSAKSQCDGIEPEETSRAVEAAMPAIRTQCWQRAFEARADDAPLIARVDARVRVDPDGYVAEVHTGLRPAAYPTLPDCIGKVLRAMRFRSCRKSTTVDIPFLFDGRN